MTRPAIASTGGTYTVLLGSSPYSNTLPGLGGADSTWVVGAVVISDSTPVSISTDQGAMTLDYSVVVDPGGLHESSFSVWLLTMSAPGPLGFTITIGALEAAQLHFFVVEPTVGLANSAGGYSLAGVEFVSSVALLAYDPATGNPIPHPNTVDDPDPAWNDRGAFLISTDNPSVWVVYADIFDEASVTWDDPGSYSESYIAQFQSLPDTVMNEGYWGMKLGAGGAPTAPSAPANDDFANAYVITGSSISREGLDNNLYATVEVDEPVAASTVGGASLWFEWTAPANGTCTIDTLGSTDMTAAVLDTALGVYTGVAVDALTLIVDNDDGMVDFTSEVSFSAVMGTTYMIQVDSFDASEQRGNINLHLELV